ncbi:MAG: hypothetical protein M3268_00940 [Acidobacteriota bacterium]|nr:hypothetical protein [Acidobacteriota bacterium]
MIVQTVALSLFVASLFCAATSAQSGRRVSPSARPGATPTPLAPVIVPPTEPAKPKRNLPKVTLVVGGRTDPKSDRADAIFNAFVIELGASMQTDSLGLVKHDDVIKRARAEKENYVVWLEIERDSYEQGRFIFNSLDYTVKYSVLAPGTAEVKARGRVYYQGMGGARTRTGEGSVVKNTPHEAGEAAADMVLDQLAFIAAHPQ